MASGKPGVRQTVVSSSTLCHCSVWPPLRSFPHNCRLRKGVEKLLLESGYKDRGTLFKAQVFLICYNHCFLKDAPCLSLSHSDGARLKAEKRLPGPGEGGRGKSWETDEAEKVLGKGVNEKKVGRWGAADGWAFLKCQHCSESSQVICLLWVFGVSGWGEVCAGREDFETVARRMWLGARQASDTLVHACLLPHLAQACSFRRIIPRNAVFASWSRTLSRKVSHWRLHSSLPAAIQVDSLV